MATSLSLICEALCKVAHAGQQLQQARGEQEQVDSARQLYELAAIPHLVRGCSSAETGSGLVWNLLAAEQCSLRDISRYSTPWHAGPGTVQPAAGPRLLRPCRALEAGLHSGGAEAQAALQALCSLLPMPLCPVRPPTMSHVVSKPSLYKAGQMLQSPRPSHPRPGCLLKGLVQVAVLLNRGVLAALLQHLRRSCAFPGASKAASQVLSQS